MPQTFLSYPAEGYVLVFSSLGDNVSPIQFDKPAHKAAFIAYLGIEGGLPDTGAITITTLGTVVTGTWQAGVIAGQFGGTGVANTGKTLTLGGNLATSGAHALTLTLSGATNVTLPTGGTLATTAQLDALIAASNAMVFKDALDCSANPNYPAADCGHVYVVSVAGKIGGASGTAVEVGDFAICTVDSTASGNQATVGASWRVIQVNLTGAVVSFNGAEGYLAGYGTGGQQLDNTGILVDDLNTALQLTRYLGTSQDLGSVSGTLPVSVNDMAALYTATLTGDVDFVSGDLLPRYAAAFVLTASGADCALTFPGDWTFIGAPAPTSLADGKRAVLSLTSLGTTDAEVIAAYAAQP